MIIYFRVFAEEDTCIYVEDRCFSFYTVALRCFVFNYPNTVRAINFFKESHYLLQ